MKAPLPLGVLIDKAVAIAALIPALMLVFYPYVARANSSSQLPAKSALYFEASASAQNLQNPDKNLKLSNSSLSYDEVLRADPKAYQDYEFNKLFKQRLKEYLEKRGSPLANHVDHLMTKKGHMADGWIRILAISYVESHMCKHTPAIKGEPTHNCSGIRRNGGYMKYGSFDGWIDDMDKVVNSNYKGRSFTSMNCRYVQPCNPRWVNGATGIYNELKTLEKIAYEETVNNIHIATAEVVMK
jgi:hypothetical protein